MAGVWEVECFGRHGRWRGLNELAKTFPHVIKGFGEDFNICDDGHEVGIALPSWDDVAMDMFRDAGTGSGAYIKSDVKALRGEGASEDVLGFNDHIEKVVAFVGGKIFEIVSFFVRGNEEVAGVVGEVVEDDVRVGASVEDMDFFIVLVFGEIGKEGITSV